MAKRVGPHNLKYNHRQLHVRHVIYFDVETYLIKTDHNSRVLPFRLAVTQDVLYDENLNPIRTESKTLFNPKDLALYFQERAGKSGRTYVIAHNAPFDLLASFTLHNMVELGWSVNIMRPDTASMVIQAKRGKTTLIFLDSLNFLRGSIDAIGKMVGLEKLHVDFDTVDNTTLETYCFRDVEILRRAFEQYLQFLKTNDLGNFGFTISSQAFNAFRHRFMHTPIHIHNDPLAKELERQAYGGGYTMPFKIGHWIDKLFYKLDVNSLYPFIMATMPMPTHFLRFLSHPDLTTLKAALEDYMVIALVTLKPQKPYFRRRTKQGTIYPTYTFKTVLTHPEVVEALAQNAILKVHAVAVYSKAIVFDKYVEELYRLRQTFKAQGNKIYDQTAKLLLNSLYGKFGTRVRKWTERPDLTATYSFCKIDLEVTKTEPKAVYFLNGKAYTFEDDGDSDNTFVAIAATVTGYGRMLILKLAEIAGWDNVYYSDTDSLIVDEKGYQNLEKYLDPNELGKLKVEETDTELTVYGKKDYVFAKHSHIKGVSPNSEKVDNNTYIVEYWTSLLGGLNTKTPKPFEIKLVKKTLKRIVNFANLVDTNIIPYSKPPSYDPEPESLYPLSFPEYRLNPAFT